MLLRSSETVIQQAIEKAESGEDIIEIGRELTAVKPSLEGTFDAWFEAETGLDRQMAYKFIGATEKFGGGAYNNYTSLSPTVLYLLSAPSTPETVVQQAIEKAEAGEISLQIGYSPESTIVDSPPPESQLRPLKYEPWFIFNRSPQYPRRP